MEKVRDDYRESQVEAAEHYDRVEDYDPVLRSHCRLDEQVPVPPPLRGGNITYK